MQYFVVPSILFIVIVAPIWLVLHYRYKRQMAKGISQEELRKVEEMLEQIDLLAERVEILERILNEQKDSSRKSSI